MKRVSLFTSNFKKYIARAAAAAVFVLLSFCIGKTLEFFLLDDVNEWSRAMFHDFYTREENIDYLFLGSSHVYCGVNPEVMEEKLGGACFNMATPAQPLNGSYYLLREVDRRNALSHVYLELYYGQSTGEEGRFKEHGQLPRNWRNTNYMKPSLNKLEYLLTMSRPEEIYLSFFPARRYWQDLGNLSKIKETVRQKRTAAYKEYHVENTINGVRETYAKGGFYVSEHRAQGGVLYDILRPAPLDGQSFTEEAETYLVKIIEYCRKREIPLTLYSAPMTDYQVMLSGDYDGYVERIGGIAKRYGVAYYDFNLTDPAYLDLQEDGLFRDKGHLNVYGADKFSAFFGDVLTHKVTGEVFLESYADKTKLLDKRILGLLAEETETPGRYLVTPVCTLPREEIYYRVSVLEEGAQEPELLAEGNPFRRESGALSAGPDGAVYVFFEPEPGTQGTLVIEAGPENSGGITNTARVPF